MDETRLDVINDYLIMGAGAFLTVILVLSLPIKFLLWLSLIAFLIYVIISDYREGKDGITLFFDFCWLFLALSI